MNALALAALLVLAMQAAAGAEALMPMNAGFHQSLVCNHGSVDIAVAAKPNPLAPGATVVTTTLTMGSVKAVTRALRTVDAAGNIYAFGYAGDGFVHRYPKRLLLPASPPRPGERSTYINISGAVIEKRFEGTETAFGASPGAIGFVFSDYSNGHKLNTVKYVPKVGVTRAVFYGAAPDRTDLSCHSTVF